MVLIDGEKLLDAVQGAINVMEAHGMNTVSATSLKAIIKCAPTVDAIPMEWLEAQIRPYTGDVSDIGKSAVNGTIKGIIRKYQKEQEAQDGNM
jgi:hypothetical protein